MDPHPTNPRIQGVGMRRGGPQGSAECHRSERRRRTRRWGSTRRPRGGCLSARLSRSPPSRARRPASTRRPDPPGGNRGVSPGARRGHAWGSRPRQAGRPRRGPRSARPQRAAGGAPFQRLRRPPHRRERRARTEVTGTPLLRVGESASLPPRVPRVRRAGGGLRGPARRPPGRCPAPCRSRPAPARPDRDPRCLRER